MGFVFRRFARSSGGTCKSGTTPGIAELIIAKQRSGPTGAVRVAFSGEYTRFDNLDESDLANAYGEELGAVEPSF